MTAAAPELLANDLGEYLRAWGRRIRSGESGALPIIVGLLLIVIFFQIEESTFLSANNIVNLLVQSAAFIMFGAAEVFVLILSEIDLAVGYTAAVVAFVIAELAAAPVNFPWWLAIIGGLVVGAAIGGLQGTLITRLGLPSFVVTLGGLLAMEGVMLELANVDKTAVGGVINVNGTIYNLVNTNMSPALGWIALVVVLAAFAALPLTSVGQTARPEGLTAPPISVTLLTIGLVALVGIVLVVVCNINRGALTPLHGVPWVVPVVLIVIMAWSWLMSRTRLGRYIYAIGANPEASRRAGINVGPDPDDRVRAVLADRGHRRAHVRVPAGLDLDRLRRRQPGSVRGRGRGDRRHQPVRRPRQADPRAARRDPDRGRVQRAGPDGHQHRRSGHRHRDRARRRRDGRLTGQAPRHHLRRKRRMGLIQVPAEAAIDQARRSISRSPIDSRRGGIAGTSRCRWPAIANARA